MAWVQSQGQLTESDRRFRLANHSYGVCSVRQGITVARVKFDSTLDVLLGLVAILTIEIGVGQGQVCLMVGFIELKSSLGSLERLVVRRAEVGRQRKVEGLHLVGQS